MRNKTYHLKPAILLAKRIKILKKISKVKKSVRISVEEIVRDK